MKVFPPAVASHHLQRGWWDGTTWASRFQASAALDPGRVAVVDPLNRERITDGRPRSLTWRQVDESAKTLASHLLTAGVRQGDVVAVQLPNIVELAVTYVAIAQIGAIITPFPVQYREHELTELAGRANARAFVTAATIAGRRNAAAVAALQPQLPELTTVLAFGDDVPDGVVALDSLTPTADERERLAEHLRTVVIDPNDAITICWTSGTESAPKGVVRGHGDWGAVLWEVIESPALTADDVLLCTFPMVGAGGLGGMFGPWITCGCTLVLHHPFDLDIFLQQIEQERVTYTVSPPAVLTRLLLAPELLDSHDLSSLRAIGSGSAPLTPFLIEGWEGRGVEVINYFGSSEGIPLVADRSNIPDPAERATFFPNFDAPGMTWRVRTSTETTLRLVDVETGEEVREAGRPGELRLIGPTVFAGYLGGEPNPFDDQGYYCTGDVFEYHDAERRLLQFVDRSKDLIIRGGFNISPAEVEGLLQTHPSVAEVAAVGAPDDLLGERVAVFVVLRAGTSLELADLIAHLMDQQVAKFKLPERLEIVDELPRNPSGKVLKRELRDRLAG